MHSECFIPIEVPTSKSHPGQWHCHTKSPNVRVQSLPSRCHELRTWQTGGVHVRFLQRPLNRVPFGDGCFGKPDRNIAAPTQGLVVFGPVGHLVFGLGELVAAAFAMFVGHGMFLALKSGGPSCQFAEVMDGF